MELTIFLKRTKASTSNPSGYIMTNFFFGTLSFSAWAILATWLNLGAYQKLQKK
jgi:hypothetical protein